MQKITIGIQPLAELRAEMLAVARGERKSDPDAPQVCFESLPALAKALRTDVATVKRVLLPSTDDDVP
jgi:predicted transcriptional regulator